MTDKRKKIACLSVYPEAIVREHIQKLAREEDRSMAKITLKLIKEALEARGV